MALNSGFWMMGRKPVKRVAKLAGLLLLAGGVLFCFVYMIIPTVIVSGVPLIYPEPAIWGVRGNKEYVTIELYSPNPPYPGGMLSAWCIGRHNVTTISYLGPTVHNSWWDGIPFSEVFVEYIDLKRAQFDSLPDGAPITYRYTVVQKGVCATDQDISINYGNLDKSALQEIP
jgi:hypothetical protein